MGKVGMAMPAVAAARGSGSSTTHSALSGGTLIIRDAAAQQDLTGMTVTQTVALLNRDTAGTLNTLKPIFDKEKIEAGFEIASEASRQMGQFLTNRAREAKALEQSLENEPEGPHRDQLALEYVEAKKWQPGGEYYRWSTAISGAVSGNVTGMTSEFAQAVAINYLQGLGASEVKRLVAQLGSGPKAEAARVAMHAIVGCAGASGKGGNCGAGAMGAGAGAVLNFLLGSDTSTLNSEEKELRGNLVQSFVVGMAKATGVNEAEAAFAAANETANNALLVSEEQSRIREMAGCQGDGDCRKEVTEKYAQISAERRREVLECEGDACVQKANEMAALLADYEHRLEELLEKSRTPEGVTELEFQEIIALRSPELLMTTDRLAAVKKATDSGSEEAKRLVWDSIAQTGALSAAGMAGGVGKGGVQRLEIKKEVKHSAIPISKPTMASNGFMYESNPKHTLDQRGARLNAGIEPKNSIDLFGKSIATEKNKNHRYSLDSSGNIHRFYSRNGEPWHWSGSTGDNKNALRKSAIPNDVKKAFGFSGKWR